MRSRRRILIVVGLLAVACTPPMTHEELVESLRPSTAFEWRADRPCFLTQRFLRSEEALFGKVVGRREVATPPLAPVVRTHDVPAALPVALRPGQELSDIPYLADHFEVVTMEVAWSVPAGLEGELVEVARYRYSEFESEPPGTRSYQYPWPSKAVTGWAAVAFVVATTVPDLGEIRALPESSSWVTGPTDDDPAIERIRATLDSLQTRHLDEALPPDALGWVTGTVAGSRTGEIPSEGDREGRVRVLDLVDVVWTPEGALPDSLSVCFSRFENDVVNSASACGVTTDAEIGDRVQVAVRRRKDGLLAGCEDGFSLITLPGRSPLPGGPQGEDFVGRDVPRRGRRPIPDFPGSLPSN
jgi:hypothetical protein